MKLLIIDDSVSMRTIQRRLLESFGLEPDDIIEAVDGRDGLRKLRHNMPVDLIILDLNMPKMDGMTCLKKIRANPHYAQIRIAVVTSESSKHRIVEAIKLGANQYLIKPFTKNKFRDHLKLPDSSNTGETGKGE